MNFQLKKKPIQLGKRSLDISSDEDELSKLSKIPKQKSPRASLNSTSSSSQFQQSKDFIPIQKTTKTTADEEEEVDPLDAFMNQNTLDLSLPSEKKQLETLEQVEQDPMEDYFETLEAKGIKIGVSGPVDFHKEIDYEQEIYKAEQAQLDQDNASNQQNFIHVLPFVDHNEIEYIPIHKNFYSPHPDIQALTQEKVEEIRNELEIKVSGMNPPKPAISFAHFGFDESLMNVIRKMNYTIPTDIQRQAIPCILSGRDVISVASTGSGKTAAYLWPMMVHIMDQPELEKGQGPIGNAFSFINMDFKCF